MSQPGDTAAARQWAAEVQVSPQLAAELVRGQFPGLAAGRVEILEAGWDNTALVVDGRWLFRFPRREIALAGVRREMAVLPLLAARLPLPIPVPEFAGQPSASYPWPFWGARLLPGRELPEVALPDSRRGRAAVAVGLFLRALHQPDLVRQVGGDLPADPMRRASPQDRARRARPALDRLARLGVWAPDPEVGRLFDRAEAADPAVGAGGASGPGPDAGAAQTRAPAFGVVSHGDLHLRHLLVADDGTATGIIDWGDLCVADPAVDLSIAYNAFAGPARADLLAAYGSPVDARRELAARVLAISMTAYLAEYAVEDHRPALLRECLAALRRAVAG